MSAGGRIATERPSSYAATAKACSRSTCGSSSRTGRRRAGAGTGAIGGRLSSWCRPSRARYAQVDPDRVLLLDANFTNNSMTLAPKAAPAARKWSLAWLIWLQDHLLTYGFFI